MQLLKLISNAALASVVLNHVCATGFEQELATLLASSSERTSAEDLDRLAMSLVSSPEYREFAASQTLPEESMANLFKELADVPNTPASTGLEPVPASIQGSRLGKPAVASLPSGPIRNAVLADPTTDLTTGQFHAMKFMGTSMESLVQLLQILNSMQSDVNEGNYLTVVAALDKQFNFVLTNLANKAVDSIFTDKDTAAKWKDALWQTHLKVSTYVNDKPGPSTWGNFKAEVVASLQTLINVAVIAKGSANEPIAPGASNAQLTNQLQNSAIDTAGIFFWRCWFRICGGSTTDVVTGTPSTTVTAPSDKASQLIEAALFIDNAIATIEDIVKDVRALKKNTPDGKAKLKNLKLRIALRLMNLLKKAVSSKAFDKVYDALKSKSILTLATVSAADINSWEKVQAAIANSLKAIVTDLNSAKPNVV